MTKDPRNDIDGGHDLPPPWLVDQALNPRWTDNLTIVILIAFGAFLIGFSAHRPQRIVVPEECPSIKTLDNRGTFTIKADPNQVLNGRVK